MKNETGETKAILEVSQSLRQSLLTTGYIPRIMLDSRHMRMSKTRISVPEDLIFYQPIHRGSHSHWNRMLWEHKRKGLVPSAVEVLCSAK